MRGAKALGAALALVAGLAAAGAAGAQVRASDPQSVAAALQRLGYRAALSTDSGGDPKIVTGMAGLDVVVLFYGCQAHVDCDSVEFAVSFATHGKFQPARAAVWNSHNRWLSLGVDDVNDPNATYDLETGKGGISDEVFAATVARVEGAMGALRGFVWGP